MDWASLVEIQSTLLVLEDVYLKVRLLVLLKELRPDIPFAQISQAQIFPIIALAVCYGALRCG